MSDIDFSSVDELLKKTNNKRVVVYDNDVDWNDECYRQWRIVSDGIKNFECESREDAEWLCNILNTN